MRIAGGLSSYIHFVGFPFKSDLSFAAMLVFLDQKMQRIRKMAKKLNA